MILNMLTPNSDASELQKLSTASRIPRLVDAAWPGLGITDRNVRFAARIALEHQPVASWKDKALNETNPRAALTALMASFAAVVVTKHCSSRF
jgi:hypothetical protein